MAEIRNIFTQTGAPRLSSRQLVDALCALPDRPYRQLSSLRCEPRNLTRQLASLGICSRTIRIAGRVVRAFEAADCVDSPGNPGA